VKEKPKKDRTGYIQICVAFITTRNGKRIYARQYGKRCFIIWVKPK
jgi:hypothetical protein